MRIVLLGESLIIMKEFTQSPATIAHQLNQNPPPGLFEAVPAFDQLALYFDPDQTNTDSLLSCLTTLKTLPPHEDPPDNPLPKDWGGIKGGVDSISSTGSFAKSSKTANHPSPSEEGKGWGKAGTRTHHKIPALYESEDLEEIVQTLKITTDQLIELHSQAIYTVEAIGFCPGFPYLSGLPPELQHLPRRPTPRTKVEPGTIAITGDQCCIYPLERPGGWNLIAHTPLTIVDPETDYFPLQVGDKIQFQPINQQQFDQLVNQCL
ncbi:MAG: 5-oxoprolinase subunit B family protein [Fimbriimonadaceae bacterium]